MQPEQQLAECCIKNHTHVKRINQSWFDLCQDEHDLMVAEQHHTHGFLDALQKSKDGSSQLLLAQDYLQVNTTEQKQSLVDGRDAVAIQTGSLTSSWRYSSGPKGLGRPVLCPAFRSHSLLGGEISVSSTGATATMGHNQSLAEPAPVPVVNPLSQGCHLFASTSALQM